MTLPLAPIIAWPSWVELQEAVEILATFVFARTAAASCQWPQGCRCPRCAVDVVERDLRARVHGVTPS